MSSLTLTVHGGQENRELLLGVREPKVDPKKYPVFSRALENQKSAASVQIEWLTDHGIEKNWQQIFRQPFAYKFLDPDDLGAEAEKALERLLASLEACCIDGIPGHSSYTPVAQASSLPIGFMGGTFHYLGRDLEAEDDIALRPLRLPVLLLMRGELDLYNDVVHHGEWLCETSLEIRAKGA